MKQSNCKKLPLWYASIGFVKKKKLGKIVAENWHQTKNKCFLKWDMECLRERNGEDSEQSQKFEGKTEKVLKTVFETQNTRFSWLKQVVNKSPGQAVKTLEVTIVEKFSKCFSRLEGLPTRESQAEPWKSLCTPCDWTFHSQTSHQN